MLQPDNAGVTAPDEKIYLLLKITQKKKRLSEDAKILSSNADYFFRVSMCLPCFVKRREKVLEPLLSCMPPSPSLSGSLLTWDARCP